MDISYNAGDGVSIPLAVIVLLAEDAGSRILEIYNSDTDAKIMNKADSSPLTLADTASNALLCDRLSDLFPEIPIMSEENKNANYDVRMTWNLYWCLDPLDGTKEFLRRNGEFTVNIALMAAVEKNAPEKGARPVLGVVHAPVLGKTYFAADGLGAYMRTGIQPDIDSKLTEPKQTCTRGNVTSIRSKEFAESDSGLVLVCSRSHLDDRTREFLSRFDDARTMSMGSSLKFMLVATGEAHIYPRLAPTMEWDTAASQVVVEEAGGVVLLYDTGKVMRYNKEDLRNDHFCVYGKRITPASNS